jgi:hypothetical protein
MIEYRGDNMVSDSVIEVIEQINEVKALLYLHDNLPPWLKDMCLSKIKALQTRKKILEAYQK